MYRALTREIEVTVEPYYLEDQSDPEDGRYVWGYRIVIINHSDQIVQLQSRYWKITDENGIVDEVRGPGVVGEQPVLGPGTPMSIRRAVHWIRHRVSWSAPIRCNRLRASCSTSRSRPSRWTCREWQER
jgi:hypothetical protein